MVQAISASQVDLRDLTQRFKLQATRDPALFPEWRDNLPELTENEQQVLDKIQTGYWNLVEHPPLLERAIQTSVLGPILLLGDVYLPPFHIQAEKSIEIAAEDGDQLIRGRIDVLLIKTDFWVLVIESKEAEFSVEAGLPQLLSYLLANPDRDKPSYGLIVSGGSFLFIKLVQGDVNQYGLSRIFEIRNPGNDLYDVLKILKRIAQL